MMIFKICINLFNKNWPDCSFDNTMTNFKDFNDFSSDNPFKALKIGEDKTLYVTMTALDAFKDYDYIFLFMDDGFLINEVDNDFVLEIQSLEAMENFFHI